MLSLLPAILLLIFRGPSALEQAHLNPGAVARTEAICQKYSLKRGCKGSHQAIRSLLALSKNQEFSKALSEIWQLLPAESEDAPVVASSAEPKNAVPQPPFLTLREGFAECERSRDGPQGL